MTFDGAVIVKEISRRNLILEGLLNHLEVLPFTFVSIRLCSNLDGGHAGGLLRSTVAVHTTF